ncbi:TPA: glycosyltransferase [Photobacterium damselae]
MKNFVIVQNSLKTTWIFRKDYIRELLKYGNVSVIAPNDDSYSKIQIEKLGANVYKIPKMDTKKNKILAILAINKNILIERKRNSIFICHFLITFLISYLTLVPFNNRLLIYTEGLGSLFYNNNLLRRILKVFLVNNSAVRLFCNKSERDLIGLPDDIVTNGIGIDLESFTVKSEISNIESYELLYIGRLIDDKGVRDSIEVLRRLVADGINVKLNLVGDIYPNNPSSLDNEDIHSLKLEFGNKINFVGFVKDINKWYLTSHVLIIPSVREGFPVCVMEASSMGLPTVGYNVEGVNSAVIQGKNGLLAEFRSIEQLTELTKSLLNTDILNCYRFSSSLYAEDNFSIKPKTQQIVNILSSFYR